MSYFEQTPRVQFTSPPDPTYTRQTNTIIVPTPQNTAQIGTMALLDSNNAWTGNNTYATVTATTGVVTPKLTNASQTINLGTTGTLTMPSATDTLVGKATTDTLTNKTITNPVMVLPDQTQYFTQTGSITTAVDASTAISSRIRVITVTATTAAGSTDQFQLLHPTFNQTFTSKTPHCLASIINYTGTIITDGIPYVWCSADFSAGTLINVTNIGSAALNGNITLCVDICFP